MRCSTFARILNVWRRNPWHYISPSFYKSQIILISKIPLLLFLMLLDSLYVLSRIFWTNCVIQCVRNASNGCFCLNLIMHNTVECLDQYFTSLGFRCIFLGTFNVSGGIFSFRQVIDKFMFLSNLGKHGRL